MGLPVSIGVANIGTGKLECVCLNALLALYQDVASGQARRFPIGTRNLVQDVLFHSITLLGNVPSFKASLFEYRSRHGVLVYRACRLDAH